MKTLALLLLPLASMAQHPIVPKDSVKLVPVPKGYEQRRWIDVQREKVMNKQEARPDSVKINGRTFYPSYDLPRGHQ